MIMMRDGSVELFGPAGEVMAQLTQQANVQKIAAPRESSGGAVTPLLK
jgi:hypothetical protein